MAERYFMKPGSKRVYQMHAYVDGVRDKTVEKLTPSMWQMLWDTARHGDPSYSRHGRAERGSASGTRWALNTRGLLKGHELTDAGRRLLTVEWRYPDEKPSAEGADA